MSESNPNEPYEGEYWRSGDKVYRVDLITDKYIILSALDEKPDHSYSVFRKNWELLGMVKIEHMGKVS